MNLFCERLKDLSYIVYNDIHSSQFNVFFLVLKIKTLSICRTYLDLYSICHPNYLTWAVVKGVCSTEFVAPRNCQGCVLTRSFKVTIFRREGLVIGVVFIAINAHINGKNSILIRPV